jgi:hypothetical protein
MCESYFVGVLLLHADGIWSADTWAVHQLYFAAYQDRIYVYQPRRCGPQILPPPSLILHPRPSKIAAKVDAVAIDFHFPHQINHLIVGNLGDLEIVLFAFDDGDVAAYYTHSIARCIRANNANQMARGGSPTSRGHLQPSLFFHENVLKSAWGLAIHSQSRMIAVGSNLHEVTVFAFALTMTPTSNGAGFPAADNSPTLPRGEALKKERRFPTRTTTWRIVLPLGPYGSNIPNLAFVDDEKGDADKIAAIDILGNIWFLDIWTQSQPVQLGPRRISRDSVFQYVFYFHHIPSSPYRFKCANLIIVRSDGGWSVLVLPFRTFKPTKTLDEAFGVPSGELYHEIQNDYPAKYLDITCSLYYIKEFPVEPDRAFRSHLTRIRYHRHRGLPLPGNDLKISDIEEDEEDSVDESADTSSPPSSQNSSNSSLGSSSGDPWEAPSLDADEGGCPWSRCIIPSLGETPRLQSISDFVEFSKSTERCVKVKHRPYLDVDFPAHLVNNFCLLRTYQTNVEAIPFDISSPRVECAMVLTNDTLTAPSEHLPWDMGRPFCERVSMLIPVPELSLVVAGSPCGRVAFITMTRIDNKSVNGMRLRCGFRVERVVPRREEESLRPKCTLIGIAVSPVPCRPGRELRLRPGREQICRPATAAPSQPSWSSSSVAAPAEEPKMYRLIMHYKDHTIMQYEFCRPGDAEELLFC